MFNTALWTSYLALGSARVTRIVDPICMMTRPLGKEWWLCQPKCFHGDLNPRVLIPISAHGPETADWSAGGSSTDQVEHMRPRAPKRKRLVKIPLATKENTSRPECRPKESPPRMIHGQSELGRLSKSGRPSKLEAPGGPGHFMMPEGDHHLEVLILSLLQVTWSHTPAILFIDGAYKSDEP